MNKTQLDFDKLEADTAAVLDANYSHLFKFNSNAKRSEELYTEAVTLTQQLHKLYRKLKKRQVIMNSFTTLTLNNNQQYEHRTRK